MAPESMIKREYSEASDAFSFGVLLWVALFFIFFYASCLSNLLTIFNFFLQQEMVTRKHPWGGLQPMQVVIAVTKENTRLKIPADCDPILRNIIRACWKEKPERR